MSTQSPSHVQLLSKQFGRGRYQRVIELARSFLDSEPDCGRTWEILGLALLRAGFTASGIDALERASLLYPLSDSTRVSLAVAYGQAGRTALSKDLLMRMATSSQIDGEQLLRIAAGLEAIDEPRLAMEACRQAGKCSPEIPRVHYDMGYYASQCGYPTSIIESLMRHAIHMDPNNVHYRVGLASLLIRVDRKHQAFRVISKSIPGQLDQVTCECCLKRIANLFFDLGYEDTARLCADRIQKLRRLKEQPSKEADIEQVSH